MADKDSVTKLYMQDNKIFADAFNYYLYGGKQVIDPERLRPLDTSAAVKFTEENGSAHLIQRYRDILKALMAMTDDNIIYLILGIENQSEINPIMPVKNLGYDIMQYFRQIDNIKAVHRRNNDKPLTNGEFLAGFYQDDRLIPVITLTVYFGSDEWNAPLDLHSMLDADDNILKYIDNYHVHLIAPVSISDEDFDKFNTELRQVMKFIKYSASKDKMNEIIHEDPAYKSMSRNAADMLNIVTGTNIVFDEKEETINMCKAFDDLRTDSLAEGMEIGMEKGMEEGIEKGIFRTLSGLVSKGIITLAQAAEQAGMPVSDFIAKSGIDISS